MEQAATSTTVVFVVCLCCLGTGCEDVKRVAKSVLGVDDEAHVDIDAPRPSNLPDAGGVQPDDVTPREFPREPLERALKKYPYLAKGAPSLGFKLTSLDELYALTIAAEVPPWGSKEADDPGTVTDGNPDTTWNCTPGDLKNCAIGLHFSAPAEVKAVRVFAAGGTTHEENSNSPRPKTIRLHTAEGFAEANVPDSSEYVYVVLGRAVRTPNLSVEFVDFWSGKTDELRVGEVEVYGNQGAARPRLDVDPRRTFVSWEGTAWRKKGEVYRPATSFVRSASRDGSVQTLALGSALRGQHGDRLLLLERLQDSSCTLTDGTVHLLDQQTRVLAPLGEMGGVGGDLFRHSEGLGLALGYTDEFSTTLAGVVIEPERGYVVKRTPLREDKRKADTFGDWGFEPLVIARSGTPLAASTPGCARATPDQLALLDTALDPSAQDEPEKKKKKKKKGKKKPGGAIDRTPELWTVCSAGDALSFLSDAGTCGSRWEIYVVESTGTLVGRAAESHRGSHLGLRRLSDEELLVEATGLDDSGSVVHLTPEGLAVLTAQGALAVPPPGACRAECGDGFPNPHAPDW